MPSGARPRALVEVAGVVPVGVGQLGDQPGGRALGVRVEADDAEPGRALRGQRERGRGEHVAGLLGAGAEHRQVAPGHPAEPQPGRPGGHVDALAEHRARRRADRSAPASGTRPAGRYASGSRGTASPSNSRGGSQPSGRALPQPALQRAPGCRSPASGSRTIWLAPAAPESALTTAWKRGMTAAARLVSARMRRALGSAIRSVNWPIRPDRPHSASMPETSWLASTRWMPCERPRRARSSSSVTASSATASRPASSTWNSSITATIRGQCPPGSSARSSASLVPRAAWRPGPGCAAPRRGGAAWPGRTRGRR